MNKFANKFDNLEKNKQVSLKLNQKEIDNLNRPMPRS